MLSIISEFHKAQYKHLGSAFHYLHNLLSTSLTKRLPVTVKHGSVTFQSVVLTPLATFFQNIEYLSVNVLACGCDSFAVSIQCM